MFGEKVNFCLREYKYSDSKILAELFYNTVHSVNARDYTKEQLNVWTTNNIDLNEWDMSFSKNFTIIAVEDDIIVGFGDIDKVGYLNRLYVHKDYQHRGIASSICDILEKSVSKYKITTHVSITAKPFFLNRGYKIIKEQEVVKDGIFLANFLMEK